MSVVPESADIRLESLNRDTATDALREVFGAMSPSARFLRYHSPVPRLSASLERALSDVDGSRHRAWRATAQGRTVGIARLVTDRRGRTELAVEVADRFQRKGIGRRLTAVALINARRSGIEQVRVYVHPANASALRLFRSFGTRFTFRDGSFEGVIPLAGAGREAA